MRHGYTGTRGGQGELSEAQLHGNKEWTREIGDAQLHGKRVDKVS